MLHKAKAACWLIFLVVALSDHLLAEEKAFVDLERKIDTIWVLICSALVFLMQAGFMCLESGFSEAKHSINVAIKNMADFILAVIVFWFFGFAIMFGESWNGWIGTSNFAVSTMDPWMAAFFVYQSVLCKVAAIIQVREQTITEHTTLNISDPPFLSIIILYFRPISSLSICLGK